MSASEFNQILKNLYNRNQAHKYLQRHHIFLTASDHVFIRGEIKRRDTIEYERDMSVYDIEEYFIEYFLIKCYLYIFLNTKYIIFMSDYV